MHRRTVVFIVYHIIGVPLFVLYVNLLVLLKIRPEFSSTFYTFFFFGGIIDLIFYIMNILVYQFAFLPGVAPLFEIFRATSRNNDWMQYSWLMSTINLIMFYLPGVQDVINLLIAFNRFCAICFPFSYQKIFTPFNTRLMIPLALIYSIIFVFPIIGAAGYAVNHSEPYVNYPVYMIAARGIPLISQSTLTMILTVTDCCICLLLYSVIAMKVVKLKKRANAAEMRMFLLGFGILLSNVPSIIYQLSWTLIDWNYAYLIFQFVPWVILIKTLSPPLLLLATNENMRREVMSLLPAKLHLIGYGSMTSEATTSVISVIPAAKIVSGHQAQ